MFKGSPQEQKAATEELRQLTLMARGLGSRLEVLVPFLSTEARVPRASKLAVCATGADTIGNELAMLFNSAMDELPREVPDESR